MAGIEEALAQLFREIRDLNASNMLENASVTRGGVRIASNEGMLIQGSQKVEGWLVVTGTERVTGLLEVLGTLAAAGVINLTGDLNVQPGGVIRASDLVIDNTGGGRISHPTVLVLAAPATLVNDIGVLGNVDVSGALNTGSNVNMPLPPAPPGATANVHMRSDGKLFAI